MKRLTPLKRIITSLLNSDIEVGPNWLDPMIDRMNNTIAHIAACQPKILSYDNKDSFEYAGACGGYIDRLGYPFCRGRILNHCEKDEGQYGMKPSLSFGQLEHALLCDQVHITSIGGLHALDCLFSHIWKRLTFAGDFNE